MLLASDAGAGITGSLISIDGGTLAVLSRDEQGTEEHMGKLDGKVACITGGTRSIGRAIAEAFLAEGASVVVNGRDAGEGCRRASTRCGAGDNAAFFAGDASKQETVEGLIDFTIERYGQLDICCLNSGGVLQDRAGGADERRGVEARDRLEPEPRVLGDAHGAATHDPTRVRPDHRDVVASRASSASRASPATPPRSTR